jgi:hypothetical protein
MHALRCLGIALVLQGCFGARDDAPGRPVPSGDFCDAYATAACESLRRCECGHAPRCESGGCSQEALDAAIASGVLRYDAAAAGRVLAAFSSACFEDLPWEQTDLRAAGAVVGTRPAGTPCDDFSTTLPVHVCAEICDLDSEQCVRRLSDGEPCEPGDSPGCEDDGARRCDPSTRTCMALGEDGAPCTGGSQCRSGECVAPGSCGDAPDAPLVCTTDAGCPTGRCVASRCAPPAAVGEACRQPRNDGTGPAGLWPASVLCDTWVSSRCANPCVLGWCDAAPGNEGVCRADAPLGETCTSTDGCARGFCASGTCRRLICSIL